ncbi:unnamed protein product, partial [Owenia fusiformis]
QILLVQSVCDMHVNHLLIGVRYKREETKECVISNNFAAFPISCGSSDTTDLYIARDRLGNEQGSFMLDLDKTITLGQPKPFGLKIGVTVGGNGGWNASETEGPPIFTYTFTVQSGDKSKVIPYAINKQVINAEVKSSVELDLAGELLLGVAGFLELCTGDLSLKLTLDTNDDISETDEANNERVIENVTIVDDGSGVCSDSLDISINSFRLLPPLQASFDTDTTINFEFEFNIGAGPSSTVAFPNSFNYKLMLSSFPGLADDSQPWVNDISGSEGTVSD